MRIKKYSFRLQESDEDIEQILVKLDGQKRSNYIREAIKFYNAHGDMLKGISNNLELILQMADHGQLILAQPIEKPEPVTKEQEKQLSDTEKILANSIQSLLNI